MRRHFVLLVITVITVITLSSVLVGPAYAWPKDGGISCERVFAKIQNDTDKTLDFAGYVINANGSEVVTVSGEVAPGEWAEVEWFPPEGFSGSVTAQVSILEGEKTIDSKKVKGHLNCPTATPTPITPTPTNTPPPLPTETPTPKEENTPTPTTTVGKKTPTSTPPPPPKTGGGGPQEDQQDLLRAFGVSLITVAIALAAIFAWVKHQITS